MAVSQSASRPTSKRTSQAASRTGTACIIRCALAINAGIILIRSILGLGSLSLPLPGHSQPRTNVLLRDKRNRERDERRVKRKSRLRGSKKKEKEEEKGARGGDWARRGERKGDMEVEDQEEEDEASY